MIGRRQDAPAGGCATETGMDGAAPLVYWIDRRDVITEVGGAWLAFALANGAPELDSASVVGRRLWDFVGDPTTGQLYRGILARARAGRAARFPFRCDAPASRRLLEMAVTAEGDGGVRFETRTLEEASRPPEALWERGAERSGDLLRVCGWCKRVDAGGWAEVEEAVARLRLFERDRLPALTHGICETCLAAL